MQVSISIHGVGVGILTSLELLSHGHHSGLSNTDLVRDIVDLIGEFNVSVAFIQVLVLKSLVLMDQLFFEISQMFELSIERQNLAV